MSKVLPHAAKVPLTDDLDSLGDQGVIEGSVLELFMMADQVGMTTVIVGGGNSAGGAAAAAGGGHHADPSNGLVSSWGGLLFTPHHPDKPDQR